MTGLVVRETVTFAGRLERVRVARQFVGAVLDPGHPCGDAAVLLVSELVTNSVRHSGSAVPGGVMMVTVAAGDKVVRVELTDRCGDGVPVLQSAAPADGETKGNRGL
jgi:anti-sigma regulatory factor (Ser/Thr protein kinase)